MNGNGNVAGQTLGSLDTPVSSEQQSTTVQVGRSGVLFWTPDDASRLHRWSTWLQKRSLLSIATPGIAAILFIGWLDHRTGPELGSSIFYLLPIMFIAWISGRTAGFAAAAFSSGIWFAVDVAEKVGFSSPAIPIWNAAARLCFYCIIVDLLGRVRRRNKSLADAVDDRTELLVMEIGEHTRALQTARENFERDIQRIAFDLHDGVCQSLTGIAFKAKVLQENLAAESLQHVEDTQRIVNLINAAVGQIRNIVRGLASPEVEFDELLSALHQLAADTEDLFAVPGSVTANRSSVTMNSPTCMHLYRIAQEATSNAIKHGRAHHIEIEVLAEGAQVTMVVRDTGKGFDPALQNGNGLGLRTMQYRAKMLGGTLEITSAPDGGTQVACVVPNAFLDGADMSTSP